MSSDFCCSCPYNDTTLIDGMKADRKTSLTLIDKQPLSIIKKSCEMDGNNTCYYNTLLILSA